MTRSMTSHAGALQSFLISPSELSEALSGQRNQEAATASRVIPLCTAWFLPNDPQKRTGLQAFHQKRIPSARYFDLDAVKDSGSPYPHMLPSAAAFAQAMSRMGLQRDDEIVVYDTQELGIFSAPRVAWTLRVFGHPRVHMLNNFGLWIEQGLPVETGPPDMAPQHTSYPVPQLNSSMVIGFREMEAIVKSNREKPGGPQVIDLRSPGRFSGKEPEPRPGLPSGHMPGSINLPLPELLDATSKRLLPAAQLRKVFHGKGIDPARPIISTCGTGVMAAVLDAALQEAGHGRSEDRRVYDGSWT